MANNLFRGKYPYFSDTDDGGSEAIISFDERFDVLEVNDYLDPYVRWIALRAAPSVVCVKIYSGEQKKWCGSGFIIECYNIADEKFEVIIITSASLLRVDATLNTPLDDHKVVVVLSGGEEWDGDFEVYDFYFNIAAIKIQVNHSVEVAKLRHVEDGIDFHPRKSFGLLPHFDQFTMTPGTIVVSLGRYLATQSGIMAVPGVFRIFFPCSAELCGFNCKELMRSTCKITKCGIGGPAINHNIEVIGMNFFSVGFTPFLPINIVFKWWKLSKGDYCRPWLGMESSNLFTVRTGIWEKIIQKFPNVKKNIIVDETMELKFVVPGVEAH